MSASNIEKVRRGPVMGSYSFVFAHTRGLITDRMAFQRMVLESDLSLIPVAARD